MCLKNYQRSLISPPGWSPTMDSPNSDLPLFPFFIRNAPLASFSGTPEEGLDFARA